MVARHAKNQPVIYYKHCRYLQIRNIQGTSSWSKEAITSIFWLLLNFNLIKPNAEKRALDQNIWKEAWENMTHKLSNRTKNEREKKRTEEATATITG